jgi:hypothetical protein
MDARRWFSSNKVIREDLGTFTVFCMQWTQSDSRTPKFPRNAHKMAGRGRQSHGAGNPSGRSGPDESGLKAFCRMDGAALVSIEVAQNKAYTAFLACPQLIFTPSSKMTQPCWQGPAYLAHRPLWRWLTYSRGRSSRRDRRWLSEQDVACAQAGLARLVKGDRIEQRRRRQHASWSPSGYAAEDRLSGTGFMGH